MLKRKSKQRHVRAWCSSDRTWRNQLPWDHKERSQFHCEKVNINFNISTSLTYPDSTAFKISSWASTDICKRNKLAPASLPRQPDNSKKCAFWELRGSAAADILVEGGWVCFGVVSEHCERLRWGFSKPLICGFTISVYRLRGSKSKNSWYSLRQRRDGEDSTRAASLRLCCCCLILPSFLFLQPRPSIMTDGASSNASNPFIDTIVSTNPALNNRDFFGICRSLSASQLLSALKELEEFRRTTENLYQQVRYRNCTAER